MYHFRFLDSFFSKHAPEMLRDRGKDRVGLLLPGAAPHHPGLPAPLLPVDEAEHPVHADARHLGVRSPGLGDGAV